MSKVFGLILAGGEGSRLGGVRKADLRIGGVPLLERVARAIAPDVSELLIASGQEETLGSYTCIRDESTTRLGPLAGIRTAVRYLEMRAEPEDVLVSVAADTPFLPRNYVVRLKHAVAEAGAAYAAWGENIYPTNSAWRFSALRDALEDAGESDGPKAILRKLGATPVDWTAESTIDPFSNINRLDDLIALQRRALHGDR